MLMVNKLCGPADTMVRHILCERGSSNSDGVFLTPEKAEENKGIQR